MKINPRLLTPTEEQRALREFQSLLDTCGLAEAMRIVGERIESSRKLAKKQQKSRSEQQASSRPDGRLNGYNIANSSLVGRMGGKRKPKRSNRGW